MRAAIFKLESTPSTSRAAPLHTAARMPGHRKASTRQAVPHRSSQRRESLHVTRQPLRDRNIFIRTLGRPFGKSTGRQQARANARYMHASDECHHGHSHPKRFGGRGRPVIRKRIEGDINALIVAQMIHKRFGPAEQFQAIQGDSMNFKLTPHMHSRRRLIQAIGFHKQPRVRRRRQHFRPKADCHRRRFCEIIERTKRDDPVACRRSRHNIRHIGRWLKAPRAPHQAHQSLGVPRLSLAGRVRDRVGKSPIDRGQSRRVGIAEIARLHRRRLAHEHQQPRAGRVPGQIDQDVDLIVTNRRRGLVVTATDDALPMVCLRSQRLRDRIMFSAVGVDKNLGIRAVMVLQQRQEKSTDRMGMQIRRDKPDAESTRGVAIIFMPRKQFNRRGMRSCPVQMFLQHRGRIDVVEIVQRIKPIARGARKPGPGAGPLHMPRSPRAADRPIAAHCRGSSGAAHDRDAAAPRDNIPPPPATAGPAPQAHRRDCCAHRHHQARCESPVRKRPRRLQCRRSCATHCPVRCKAHGQHSRSTPPPCGPHSIASGYFPSASRATARLFCTSTRSGQRRAASASTRAASSALPAARNASPLASAAANSSTSAGVGVDSGSATHARHALR